VQAGKDGANAILFYLSTNLTTKNIN